MACQASGAIGSHRLAARIDADRHTREIDRRAEREPRAKNSVVSPSTPPVAPVAPVRPVTPWWCVARQRARPRAAPRRPRQAAPAHRQSTSERARGPCHCSAEAPRVESPRQESSSFLFKSWNSLRGIFHSGARSRLGPSRVRAQSNALNRPGRYVSRNRGAVALGVLRWVYHTDARCCRARWRRHWFRLQSGDSRLGKRGTERALLRLLPLRLAGIDHSCPLLVWSSCCPVFFLYYPRVRQQAEERALLSSYSSCSSVSARCWDH